MVCDLIDKAQKGDKEAMLFLIKKFEPLLKKYAKKLNYEDAYEDIMLYFIELIDGFRLNKFEELKDERIVAYINISVINYFRKRVKKIVEMKREIVLSALTQEQEYYVEVQTAKSDCVEAFTEYGFDKILNQNERRLIYLVYVKGYTTAEIARMSNKSRQAVNQLKTRALKKIKTTMDKCS